MKRTPLFLYLFFSCCALQGMEENYILSTEKSCIIQEVMAQDMRCNVVSWSHDVICALALVSKRWQHNIQHSAGHRRRYLAFQKEYAESRAKDSKIYQQTTWHPHKSAYIYWRKHDCWSGYVYVNEHSTHEKDQQPHFYMVHIDNNTIMTRKLDDCYYQFPEISDGFYTYSLIDDNYRPFFNHKGEACFHLTIYAKKLLQSDSTIIEQTINSQGVQKQSVCLSDFMYIKESQKKQPVNKDYFIWVKDAPRLQPTNKLTIFANHPTLLNAFLRSTFIMENNDTKIFSAAGIELHEEYIKKTDFPCKNKIISQCIIKK